MANHDIIVIGASAGGVEVITNLVASLPADLPAAVFIVLHVPPFSRSVLPDILARAGPLPVSHAVAGEPVRQGHVYIAPPDRHIILEKGTVELSAGPRENRVRPAIDALFRSAALSYHGRVVGVILSGTLSDGTAGLYEIKRHGGIAIVQDPSDALFPDMPKNAIEQVPIDYILPASQIPETLVGLAGTPQETERGAHNVSPDQQPRQNIIKADSEEQVEGKRDQELSVYVCPECGGAMWQVNAGKVVRFSCHVGHVYSGDDLLEGYSEDLERSLWHAARTLRDRANLLMQLARVARERNSSNIAARYDEESRMDNEHAGVIEQMLSSNGMTHHTP